MIPESLNDFVSSLDQYDWFADAELDEMGRFVVYVNSFNFALISKIPDYVSGYRVLFHFAASQPDKPLLKHDEVIELADDDIEILGSDAKWHSSSDDELREPCDLEYVELISELDRLETLCGSNILQDIFFESHDKHNAVTNLSVKFPDIRKSMDALYAKYGFDVIYDQLDD
jgi:hypothetical protein